MLECPILSVTEAYSHHSAPGVVYILPKIIQIPATTDTSYNSEWEDS